LIAVGVNSFIDLQLRGNKENLNVGAVRLHVLGDLVASVGVVVAGAIIVLTGWLYADPLISVGIAALIAWGALRIVLDTVNVLLEGVPKEIDLRAVESAIARTPGIEGVHDLHIWSVSGRDVALSCHVVVPLQNLSATEHLVREVEQSVCARFGIAHTTIQAGDRDLIENTHQGAAGVPRLAEPGNEGVRTRSPASPAQRRQPQGTAALTP